VGIIHVHFSNDQEIPSEPLTSMMMIAMTVKWQSDEQGKRGNTQTKKLHGAEFYLRSL